MEYDAFIGGIEPGGLRNKNEIRILLCYLVNSIGAPLSRESRSQSGRTFPSGLKDAITYTRFVMFVSPQFYYTNIRSKNQP